MSETSKTAAHAVPTIFSSCQEWGCGGRFAYDPATQTRTRLEEVKEQAPAQAKAEAPVAPTGATKKEKTNG